MRVVAIVVVLVGCGDVPASDIDGDGIADDDDNCQASFADEVIDSDGDGKDATQDLCPHDNNAPAGDLDGDGIPDACDPFFDDSRRDTRQCITSFGVRWMNASVLTTRAGEQPFDLTPPLRAKSSEAISVVSTRALDFPTVSFDVIGEAAFGGSQAAFWLWLRATETPSNEDVACGVGAQGDVFIMANGALQAVRPIVVPAVGAAFPFRLRASVGGSNANVLCRVTVGSETVTTTFEADLVAGRWGFASQITELRIDSMVIDTKDAPVPYRYSLD